MLVGKGWLCTLKTEGFKYADMFVVIFIAMLIEANKNYNWA